MCYHIETISLVGKFVVRKKDLKIYVRIGHHIPDPVDQAGVSVGILSLQDEPDLILGV